MLLVEHVAEPIHETRRVGLMQLVHDRGRQCQAGDPRARLVIHPEGVAVVRLVSEIRDVTARELVLVLQLPDARGPEAGVLRRMSVRQEAERDF